MKLDRRTFLGAAGATAMSSAWPARAHRHPGQPASGTLSELPRGDVLLLDGIAQKQAAQTLEALLRMDEDALLRPFRAAAGLPVGPHGLGGWYDASPDFAPPINMTGYIPGHSFGQYVSALARAYAGTGDARARAKVDRLIAGFAPTITSAFYQQYPIPAYTYDKIVVGLIDAHAFGENREALKLLAPATDAAMPWLPPRAMDRAETRHAKPNVAFSWDES